VFFPAKGGVSDDPKRGWRGVDRIVGTVREVWDRPLALVADPRVGGEVSAVLAAAEACVEALGPAGGEAEGGADTGGLNGAVAASFRSFSLDGPEGAVYAWNRRVEQYNNGLGTEVGADVRELARILNDYREMMGLRRCFIDPRLCRSSRKHAAACSAAGKTGSAGKDGTPESRAEAEGFLGAVGAWAAQEPGSPRDLWEQVWYRSGGAHRSVLKRTWNSLGFGREAGTSILTFGNTIPPEGL
jgi:hypothetical protein